LQVKDKRYKGGKNEEADDSADFTERNTHSDELQFMNIEQVSVINS